MFPIKNIAFIMVCAVVFSIAACTATSSSLLSNHTLPNNLKVIIDEKKSDQAEVRLLIKAGSLQEQDSQQGFAHFVEHLAFNHTQKYPKETLFRKLESLGLSLGIHSNAETNFDHTIYKLSLKNPTDEKLETAIDILSQWAMQIQFDQTIINAEKGIVREEWRLRQPQQQGWQANYLKAIHNNSRYNNRLPIGDLKTIEQATANDLEAFYKKWYQPHNATVIVTGAIDTEKTKGLIEKHFTDWKSTNPAKPETHNLDIKSIPKQLILADPKIDMHRVELNYYLDYSRPRSNEAMLERQVWSAAFQILDQRMKQRLQETRGKVSRLGVFYDYPSPDILLFSLFADVPGKDFKTATSLLNEEIQKLIRYGITEEELNSWVKQKLDSRRAHKESPADMANFAVEHALYNAPLLTWDKWLEQLEDYLPKLTTKQINTFVAGFLSKSPNVLLVHNPATPVPDKALLAEWLESSTKQVIASNKPSTTKDKGAANHSWEIEPKTPGTITATRAISDKLSEWTLSNGIKVYYQYSKEKSGQVWYKLSGLGGIDHLTQEQSIHARLALETIGGSGLRDMNGPQLSKWLEEKNLLQQPLYNFWERGMQGRSLSKDFDLSLRLLHIGLTEGQVDPQTWQHFLASNRQQLTQLNNSRMKPWREALEKTIFRQDIAFRALTLDELNAVKPEHLQQIYAQYYSGAQNYRLAIIGDIDEASARKAVLHSIATLPESKQSQKPSTRSFPRIEQPADLTITGSGERTAKLIYKLTLDKSALPSMTFTELSYLQPWLHTSLMETLREKEGLAYSVGVVVESDFKSAKDYTLTIELACDPDKVTKVRERIVTLLDSLTHGAPPDEQRLRNWQQERQAGLKKALKEPSEVAGMILFSPLQNIPLERVRDVDYRTRRPAPEALQQALKALTDPKATPVWMAWLP